MQPCKQTVVCAAPLCRQAGSQCPLWNGRFSFGTEETFTNRHDIFTQNGFSADADDHIKQSVYAAFADYSKSIRHWKLNMGIRYEHQQTDYYEKE